MTAVLNNRTTGGDIARERAALGAAILDSTAKQAGILIAMLGEDDFVASLNRACFVAIRRLVGRGIFPLEYVSVTAELQDMGVFERYANGLLYVTSLGEGVNLAYQMTKRVKEIQDAARRRNRAARLEAALAER